jgi:hypothetical protein
MRAAGRIEARRVKTCRGLIGDESRVRVSSNALGVTAPVDKADLGSAIVKDAELLVAVLAEEPARRIVTRMGGDLQGLR